MVTAVSSRWRGGGKVAPAAARSENCSADCLSVSSFAAPAPAVTVPLWLNPDAALGVHRVSVHAEAVRCFRKEATEIVRRFCEELDAAAAAASLAAPPVVDAAPALAEPSFSGAAPLAFAAAAIGAAASAAAVGAGNANNNAETVGMIVPALGAASRSASHVDSREGILDAAVSKRNCQSTDLIGSAGAAVDAVACAAVPAAADMTVKSARARGGGVAWDPSIAITALPVAHPPSSPLAFSPGAGATAVDAANEFSTSWDAWPEAVATGSPSWPDADAARILSRSPRTADPDSPARWASMGDSRGDRGSALPFKVASFAPPARRLSGSARLQREGGDEGGVCKPGGDCGWEGIAAGIDDFAAAFSMPPVSPASASGPSFGRGDGSGGVWLESKARGGGRSAAWPDEPEALEDVDIVVPNAKPHTMVPAPLGEAAPSVSLGVARSTSGTIDEQAWPLPDSNTIPVFPSDWPPIVTNAEHGSCVDAATNSFGNAELTSIGTWPPTTVGFDFWPAAAMPEAAPCGDITFSSCRNNQRESSGLGAGVAGETAFDTTKGAPPWAGNVAAPFPRTCAAGVTASASAGSCGPAGAGRRAARDGASTLNTCRVVEHDAGHFDAAVGTRIEAEVGASQCMRDERGHFEVCGEDNSGSQSADQGPSEQAGTVDEVTRHLLHAREKIEAVEVEFSQIMGELIAYGQKLPGPLSRAAVI